jgi:hypothetical protein
LIHSKLFSALTRVGSLQKAYQSNKFPSKYDSGTQEQLPYSLKEIIKMLKGK